MGCNCGDNEYNIRVDNNGNCEPTTPIYNITLGNVGVDGYSPTLDVVDETSSTFKIQVVNKSSTVISPAIPKFDYLTNNYVSNITLANTLADYSTTVEIASTYLKTDGSNADSSVNLNNLYISGDLSVGDEIKSSANTLYIENTNLSTGDIRIETMTGDIILNPASKAKYGSYEIATLNNIPTVGNGTITLTQNGVTKGSFTTNQSGNTTIDLDAGGSSITNPLVISNRAENRTLSLGIDEDNDKVLFNYSIGGIINVPIPLLYNASQPLVLTERNVDGLYTLSLNIDSNTLDIDQDDKLTVKEMTGSDSITGGTAGLVPAPAAGDQDKYLKGDGTWSTVTSGTTDYTNLSNKPSINSVTLSGNKTTSDLGLQGALTAGSNINISGDTISATDTTYTAGNGINITNDTISVKDVQSFTHITIANGYNTGEGLFGKLDDGSAIIPLVRVSDLDDVIIGDGSSKLVLHGDETRPSYFNGQTTSYLALYSDIPDTSDMATKTWVGNQGYLTSSALSGYATETWVGQQGYALASSLATVATTGDYANLLNKPTIPTNSDYVDLTSNQTVGGNKTFTGTNYFRNTYICNASGTYFGRMRAVDSKFTFEGIGTNRSINFIPDGTGELQYDGVEVATVNDIPDVSQLQEKLTAGDGIELSEGSNIPLERALPYTFNSTRANTNFVSSENFDTTKERVVILEVPVNVAYVTFWLNGVDGRYGICVENTGLSDIYISDGSYSSKYNTTSFPVSGSHNYLKFVIDTDNKSDIYYSYDNSTWTLLLSKTRSNQDLSVWANGVNICNDETTGWTLSYLSASYGGDNGVISCDNTIARVADLATVATSGSYNDLSNKPTIPAAQVNSDWNASGGVSQILNKPTIPTVNNATLTIQKNGTDVATFTANSSSDVTANITVPTNTNELTNGAGFITSSALSDYVQSTDLATVATSGSYNDLTDKPYIPSGVVVDQTYDATSQNAQSGVAIAGAGFLTGITLGDVTTALGYTPYNGATNPNGYTSNVGTVTSVNNTSPINGNVTISIPTVTDTYSATSSNAMSGKAVASALSNSGFITGITSSMVTTALGYTPYNSTNPNGYQANVIETVKVNGTALTVTSKAVDVTVPTKVSDLTNDSGYTSNVGTVTKVNNTSPDSNGNVTISIPSAVTETTVSGWGFTKNTGTVTSVNNVSPVNGNVSLTIPTVNNATLTIQKNGTTVKTFTANASSDVTCNITVPTKTSDLTNDSSFISGITSSMVTTALGYTPYNSTNPSGFVTTDTKNTCGAGNSTSKLYLVGRTAQSTGTSNSNSSVYTQNGYLYATTPAASTNNTTVATTAFVKAQGYTTNTGTVTSVNNVSPVNGNVTIAIPTVPTNVSAFTNDSGYITGITGSNVTTALGYTPANQNLSNLSATGQAVIDNSITAILELMYPVGAIFIGTTSTCPMAQFFGTWELVAADRVLQGSSSNHAANTTIAAGLPNIKGSISSLTNQMKGSTNPSGSGALSVTKSTSNYTGYGSGDGNTVSSISFNANSSNSIYSDSVTTVQPPAYVVNVWRRTA